MSNFNNADAYGPWTLDETARFAASVTGAHEDSRNHRFDFESVAAELAGKTFDAAVLWQTLETFRLRKDDAYAYGM